MQTLLEASGMSLVPIQMNLIDAIWEDRPAPPCNVIQPHPLKYSGTVQEIIGPLSAVCVNTVFTN